MWWWEGWGGVVSRGLTYVNVFPTGVPAAVEKNGQTPVTEASEESQ